MTLPAPCPARSASWKPVLSAVALGVLCAACATVGTAIRFPGPSAIHIGRTDKADLIAEFDQPTFVGYDNGSEKWTYAYYHYSLFGAYAVKDLDVVFDKNGVVSSYTYESSDPDEVQKQLPASPSQGGN